MCEGMSLRVTGVEEVCRMLSGGWLLRSTLTHLGWPDVIQQWSSMRYRRRVDSNIFARGKQR